MTSVPFLHPVRRPRCPASRSPAWRVRADRRPFASRVPPHGPAPSLGMYPAPEKVEHDDREGRGNQKTVHNNTKKRK